MAIREHALLRSAWRGLKAPLRGALGRRPGSGDGPDEPPTAADRASPRAIEVRQLTVAYEGRPAIVDLSGRFAPAALTAVVGPNGAGKTTLLRALAGSLRPRSGSVLGIGEHRHRLAYLPQQAELDRGFPVTVAELVALGGWRGFGAFRRPPPDLAGRVEAALGELGLLHLAARRLDDLSAGQFQRALFARLVLQDARVILLDEPFAAVDERTTEDLLARIRRWPEEGRTAIVVLHDLEQVRRHFPHTLLLARSCIAWGDTAAALSAENLARARQALAPAFPDRIATGKSLPHSLSRADPPVRASPPERDLL